MVRVSLILKVIFEQDRKLAMHILSRRAFQAEVFGAKALKEECVPPFHRLNRGGHCDWSRLIKERRSAGVGVKSFKAV